MKATPASYGNFSSLSYFFFLFPFLTSPCNFVDNLMLQRGKLTSVTRMISHVLPVVFFGLLLRPACGHYIGHMKCIMPSRARSGVCTEPRVIEFMDLSLQSTRISKGATGSQQSVTTGDADSLKVYVFNTSNYEVPEDVPSNHTWFLSCNKDHFVLRATSKPYIITGSLSDFQRTLNMSNNDGKADICKELEKVHCSLEKVYSMTMIVDRIISYAVDALHHLAHQSIYFGSVFLFCR